MLKFDRRNIVAAIGLVLLVAMPFIAELVDNRYLVSTASRILIFALAAVSLDLLIGYAGLPSFGHAAFFGIGSYVAGLLGYHAFDGSPLLEWPVVIHGTDLALISWPLAIGISALAALAIGAVSLRAEGVFFIMITLAFGQMIYFLGVSMSRYGGDDGLNLNRRNILPGIDITNDVSFYYVCLGLLVAFVALCQVLVNSRFGMVLRSCQQNERRTRALGIPTYRYKLAAFTFAGAGAGLAGALMSNQTLFISAHNFDWKVSGDLMIMVILGGIATLRGPIIGAAVFLLLGEFLGVRSLFGPLAEHWQFVFGAILILVVLYAPRGLYGWFLGGARDHG